jgi:hypothetical protein
MALGSPLPYAGTIVTIGFTNSGGSLNDVQVFKLKHSTPTGGNPQGYDISVFSDDTTVTTTGFSNTAGTPRRIRF